MELSSVQETEITLPFVTADATGPKHLNLKLTRAKFESMVDDILQRSVVYGQQAGADFDTGFAGQAAGSHRFDDAAQRGALGQRYALVGRQRHRGADHANCSTPFRGSSLVRPVATVFTLTLLGGLRMPESLSPQTVLDALNNWRSKGRN